MNRRTVDHVALAAKWEQQSKEWTVDDPAPVARPVSSTFVQPPAPIAKMSELPAWMLERQPFAPDVALQAMPVAIKEITSGQDRAKALQWRLLPFLGLWAIVGVVLGVGVVMVGAETPVAAMAGLAAFAGLGAYTYRKLVYVDFEFGAGGVERHRIDAGVDLAKRRMAHEHELRRLALDAYLTSLDRHDRAQLEDRNR